MPHYNVYFAIVANQSLVLPGVTIGPGLMGNELRDIGGPQYQGGHWSPGHRHKYPNPG